jgi:outer membrane protein, multidrug efflux system
MSKVSDVTASHVTVLVAIVQATIVMTGCTVGPNYKRPAVSVPAAYRGLPPDGAPADGLPAGKVPADGAGGNDRASLGDEPWWDVFQDEQLRQLIKTALQNNYDVRRAGTRILQAQAVLGITRSDQFPTITGQAGATGQRIPRSKVSPAVETSSSRVGVGFDWELDFWGKFRRSTEAARASLAATEWAKREIVRELLANVAGSYFTLRALDRQLEIARNTLASRQDSLRLTRVLAEGGATSLLDVRQAEQLVFTAGSTIPALELDIEQEENFISILLGGDPAPIPRGRALTEQLRETMVPPGLPASLLERRPDILEAEHQLIAANARIGAARALYFPQIALTGVAGYQSSALTALFASSAGFWTAGAALAQPIFNAGRLRSNVRLTEAQQQEAALIYEQTIRGAFRDVSDALIAYRKTREVSQQQKLLVDSAQDATRLSQLRYSGGASSYLEVLTNDTNYFSAELALVQAQLDAQLAMVQLYKSLGGGWQ